jgi:hypothetical protein
MTSDMVVAIPWYRREDWGRLKSILSDASALHDAFEDWQKEAVSVERTLRRQGHRVERVVIDIDVFRTWCFIRGRPTDAAARSEYALESVRSRGSRQSKDVRNNP